MSDEAKEKEIENNFIDANEVVGTDREEMPTQKKKTKIEEPTTTRRKRVTFYVRVPGQKRRKKVSFLARR